LGLTLLARGVEQKVGGAGANVLEDVVGGARGDGVVDLAGAEGGVAAEDDGSSTSNVGGSHAGTGDGPDGVGLTDPGSGDGGARGEDINAGAVVGERRADISGGGGSDGEGVGGISRGVVAGIGIVVTGSDGVGHTDADRVLDSADQGSRATATERHVGNRGSGARLVSIGDIVNSRDDASNGSASVGSQHLDGDEGNLLGNTVELASNSAGYVSAVAVAINVLSIDGESPGGTAFEVNVVDLDTGINHIGIDTLTSRGGVVVVTIEVKENLADAVKVPQDVGLIDALVLSDGDNLVALNVGYIGMSPLTSKHVNGQLGRITPHVT